MNILLTAAGRRAYLVDFFKEALKMCGGGYVCVANTTADATAYLAADDHIIVPPSSSETYIRVLLDYCQAKKIKLLFSLHDWDAPIIAQHKDAFLEIGTIPVMAKSEILQVCLDKYQTMQMMNQLGICVPKTYLNLNDVLNALKRKELHYPLIIKPRWGQGSLGIFKVESEEELKWGYYFSNKQANAFASTCSLINPNEPQVIIQECIVGEEYGCDIINDLNGSFRRAFVKHKFGMRSGETDAAETVENTKILEDAQKIARWSAHLGCMDSDFMMGKDGIPYLIELNPRFGGGYPFSHCAGANVPLACIRWAMGDEDFENIWASTYQLGVKTFKDIALKTI